MTPQWLLSDEAYVPPSDSEAFIDRSIRALLRVLGMLRLRPAQKGKGTRIDPRVKLVSLSLLVLLISLSRSPPFVALVGTVLLILLSLQQAETILEVLKACLPAGVLTFLIMLPSALWKDAPGAVGITVKVLICVAAVRLFSATTGWAAISRALAAFRLPDLLVLVLDITGRSIALLGRVSLEMMYALKLRSVGRNRAKIRSLGGIAGTLFLKSREMGEDLYAAMECRCFTGTYRVAPARRLHWADALPFAVDALLLAGFFMVRI